MEPVSLFLCDDISNGNFGWQMTADSDRMPFNYSDLLIVSCNRLRYLFQTVTIFALIPADSKHAYDIAIRSHLWKGALPALFTKRHDQGVNDKLKKNR